MLRWIRRGWLTFRRWLKPLTAVNVEDLPEYLNTDHVYLVGNDGFPWQAAMLCPCGCRAFIQLSLIEQDRPRWRVTVDQSEIVTLHPSVWRTTGCRSHFFVREGRILWAREGEQTTA